MNRKCLVIAGLLLMTCSTIKSAAINESAILYGREWVLVFINGKAPVKESQVTMVLKLPKKGKGDIFGFASCNNYFGTYTIEQHQINIGLLMTTKMRCQNPYFMKQEQIFQNTMQEMTYFKLEDNSLTLTNEYGDKLLMFKGQ